ncbi:cell adhesion molecule 2, partial [Biomphalaria pfeifferi]
MSRRFAYLRTFFISTLCLQVYAINVTTTWPNDTFVGTIATLKCSWTASPGETPSKLFLSSNDNTIPNFFACDINTDPPYTCTRGALALDRHTVNSSLRGYVTMLINNLQCSDGNITYFCFIEDFLKSLAVSYTGLTVKVQPTVPTISNVQTDVQVYSNITATCTAALGYPKAGQIVWRVYKNRKSVELSSELRITVLNVTQPGDDKCNVRTTSSVTLYAYIIYQNISLACFVINQDFKPTAPENCTNPATDLCAQTGPTVVTYPVYGVWILIQPDSNLYVGTSVTLICQAHGNPLPTYSWTKVGDENRTLSIAMNGLFSTVTFNRLNPMDAGDYSCTVSNVVKNVNYSTTAYKTISIYGETTPAPTPPPAAIITAKPKPIITVTSTWLSDTIMGSTATLKCDWTAETGEIPSKLFISSFDDTIPNYFACDIDFDPPYSCTRGVLALERHMVNSSLQGSVIMHISNLQCSDKLLYFCFVQGAIHYLTVADLQINIKVRPTVPILSNVRLDVQETSVITATCTAVVDYPNTGRIIWKSYRNGLSFDINSDLRYTNVKVNQPGDDECTVRTQSIVTITAYRRHQNISLACFVISQDFKPTASNNCTDPASDLCAQTDPATVIYPVSIESLFMEPTFPQYEGDAVTLKCQAVGNPLPTYTWIKVGDENRTLSSVMDGLFSTVNLTSLNKTLDAGEYRCLASNVVNNMKYFAYDFITITI